MGRLIITLFLIKITRWNYLKFDNTTRAVCLSGAFAEHADQFRNTQRRQRAVFAGWGMRNVPAAKNAQEWSNIAQGGTMTFLPGKVCLQ